MQGLLLALKALSAHRLRSALAILGIFLGTVVLTCIVHVGAAMIKQADEETRKLGPNLVQVRALRQRFTRTDTIITRGSGGMVSQSRGVTSKNSGSGGSGASSSSSSSSSSSNSSSSSSGSSSSSSSASGTDSSTSSGSSSASRSRFMTTLTQADARVLANSVPQVENMAVYIAAAKGIRYGAIKSASQVLGVTASYAAVRSITLQDGRFFRADEDAALKMVCVLGHAIAERLFGNAMLATGNAVIIGDARLEVIGVAEEKGSDMGGTSFDEQVFVPLATYMRRLSDLDRISGIYMNLYAGSDTNTAMTAMEDILRKRHKIRSGAKDDFRVSAAQDATQLRNDTLDLVSKLGILSAGISFAVGGLGIFSIMILMVRSRKVEIGVRRAVGASRKFIIRQFLTEAGLMSGIGGLGGIIVALGLVSVIYAIGGFPPVYNPLFCLGAALVSVAVGVAAGAWPAWQASKVEVLDVLKSWE